MFKADGSLTITGKKMAVKTVDMSFLHGQSIELFRAVIKSQATFDPYERRLSGFLKKMDARSSDAIVEFAKRNPAIDENRTITFLSSERAMADSQQVSNTPMAMSERGPIQFERYSHLSVCDPNLTLSTFRRLHSSAE